MGPTLAMSYNNFQLLQLHLFAWPYWFRYANVAGDKALAAWGTNRFLILPAHGGSRTGCRMLLGSPSALFSLPTAVLEHLLWLHIQYNDMTFKSTKPVFLVSPSAAPVDKFH
jgi:hypothetical protein